MSNLTKTAFLFAGQGSQYPGMGKELVTLYPDLRRIFTAGSDILGFDLEKLCFEAEAEELAKTENSQPAIFSVSLIAFEAVKKKEIFPDMVGGHSLGEYAAMVACGMLSLENGFKAIKARAKAMGECAKNQSGAMCAVISISPDEISEVLKGIGGYVVPVNYNSLVQTVIAGEATAVDKAAAIFSEMGKKAVKLAVNAAFHSKLMQPAADEFKKAVANLPFEKPSIPFYSNLNGKALTDFSDMPEYLASHIVSPVKFTDELFEMQKAGAELFIECGPGKVLTGLVKRTIEGVGVKTFNVENEKSLEKIEK